MVTDFLFLKGMAPTLMVGCVALAAQNEAHEAPLAQGSALIFHVPIQRSIPVEITQPV